MDSLISSICGKVFDCLVEPLQRQIGYVLNYRSNFKDLEKGLQELQDAEERVKNNITTANNKGEHIHQDVQNWLADVAKIAENTKLLVTRWKEKQNGRCFLGWCPDLESRYQLSKEAVEQLKNLVDLYEKSNRFTAVSFVIPPNGFGVGNSHLKGYLDFESRSPTLKQLMEALAEAEVDTIGVYGMGGVGKTTLVKEAAQKAKQCNLFDKVLIVTISWKQDIEKIQAEIADKLGLEFHEQSKSGRADRLYDRLKEVKRLLVVLDDLWSGLALEKVGIPHGDAHKGCKLLLTSRRSDVLRCYMNAQKIFEVGVLQTKEAWTLFKKVVGDRVESPDLKDIADKVAKKCAGLPIAILTVAKALKGKGLEEWKNALRELERPGSRNTTDIPNDAYRSLEFSYDKLESNELKSVFLLCGYMGGFHIIDLVKYGVGLGLFQGVYSMEETRDRVQALVCKLEACSLLLSRPVHEQFAMHDVVRDVAISIVSKDTQIFVMRHNVGPKEFPDKDELKNCTAITLFDVHIRELPLWECPKLKFFHIFNKNPSLEIPEDFFELMVELRVVDLTNMHIMSLPSSLLNLANLRTLCLDHSILGDISGIGELKSLEVLSFIWSEINQLPKEIGELTNLKLLDLDHCSKLEVIPPGVISRLTRLEELYMNDSFKNWEFEGLAENRRNATLSELKHLPRLTAFEAHIRDVRLIPRGLFTGNLVRYHIFIGDEWGWDGGYGDSRTLKLKHDMNQPLDDGVLILLKKAEDLYLDEHKGTGNVLCRLDREGFPQLKHLHVQNNPGIEYIMDSSAEMPRFGSKFSGVFPMLESLSLQNLINLEKILKGNLLAMSFRKLRTVKLGKCERLRSLFSLYVAKKGLTQLEEVEVVDCKSVFTIFVDEEYGKDEIVEEVDDFKNMQLRSLTLKYLPALVSLCSELNLPSTSPIRGTKPLPVFNEKILFPQLESLELVSLRIEKIWKSPEHSSSFRELAKLIIDRCGLVEYVLTSSMLSRLERLKQLEISNCKKINKIILTEESQDKGGNGTISFPQLVFLKMDNLPNLRNFHLGDYVALPFLQHLQIQKCPKLKELVGARPRNTDPESTTKTEDVDTEDGICSIDESLFNEKIQAPYLKELRLSSLEITKVWPDQQLTAGFSVQKLASLILQDCNRLQYLFPSYVVQSLARLVKLEICGCGNVVSIVAAASDVDKAEKKKNKVKFPKLDDMKLDNLSRLSRFCHGDYVDFPSLKSLIIQNCPHLNSFISDSWVADITTNATATPLFDEKVGFRTLERLTISHMGNLTKIWHNHLQPGSFYHLSYLKVKHCAKLSSVFPSTMLSNLRELDKIQILHCASVLVLFEDEGTDAVEPMMAEAAIRFDLPRITSLELHGLPELQTFFSGNHIRWPLLKSLHLFKCESMKPVVQKSLEAMDPEIRPEIQIE